MPKYHQLDNWDADTNAPSHNFTYDFDVHRFFVRDCWRQMLHNRNDGSCVSGSVEALIAAFSQGASVKVAISGLCDDLCGDKQPVPHEVFVQTIACYSMLRDRLFIAATHPLVRVRPAIPMQYITGGWDFGWLIVRTDGQVSRLLYDPYTLRSRRSLVRCDLRWFVQ